MDLDIVSVKSIQDTNGDESLANQTLVDKSDLYINSHNNRYIDL